MSKRMNMQLALQYLDKHASEFNFPAFDNAYVEMAAARLTAFRDVENWVIAFEVLGFSNRQGIFADDVYAFGSRLGQEGFISSTPVMSQSPSNPMTDPLTDAWIADWEHWSVLVKGKCYEFSPSRGEYISQGIEVPSMGGPGSLREGHVMRFFIYRESARDLFMEETELRHELQLSSDMTVFVQTEEWQHPDVAGGEKPSDSISIKSLLVALDVNSPADFQRGRPNTNWKLWDSSASAS
jgi:hypothetical protein